jgi:hypothetical protein
MSNTSSNSTAASGGTSILGLLGIAFVVLKLVGVIDWSWWLVTLPFWGGFVLILGIGLLVLIGWLIAKAVRKLRRQRR